MKNWMKSADGMMKKAKSAITDMMPAAVIKVDNRNNPGSALNMRERKGASRGKPSPNKIREFRLK